MWLKVLLAGSNYIVSVHQSCYYDVRVFEHMCSLMFFSCQTRGSTHVWPQAPVARRPGVPSWRSKVKRCLNGCINARRRTAFASDLLCFSSVFPSTKNQAPWWSPRAITRTSSRVRPPNLRSPTSPRIACRCPGSQASLVCRPCPLLSSKHSGRYSTSCIFTLNVFSDIIPWNKTCSSTCETETCPTNLKGIP